MSKCIIFKPITIQGSLTDFTLNSAVYQLTCYCQKRAELSADDFKRRSYSWSPFCDLESRVTYEYVRPGHQFSWMVHKWKVNNTLPLNPPIYPKAMTTVLLPSIFQNIEFQLIIITFKMAMPIIYQSP